MAKAYCTGYFNGKLKFHGYQLIHESHEMFPPQMICNIRHSYNIYKSITHHPDSKEGKPYNAGRQNQINYNVTFSLLRSKEPTPHFRDTSLCTPAYIHMGSRQIQTAQHFDPSPNL